MTTTLANTKFNPLAKHTLVANLIAATARNKQHEDNAIARAQTAAEGDSALQADLTVATRLVRSLDDVKVVPQLYAFCTALREVSPRIKFGVDGDCSWMRTGPYRMHSEVWMYLPEQPYAIMRLGYKNYFTSDRASQDFRYGIYSRMIFNDKYNPNNDQYCMSMSGDLTRAVRAAKKYMRGYSPEEMILVNVENFRDLVREETQKFNSECGEASNEVRQSTDLLIELTHLVDAGYEFKTPTIKGLIENYRAKRTAMQEHNARARHAWFVHVHMRGEKQMFDVVEILDVHKQSQANVQRTELYDETTLPEEIAGKLSVLTMMQNKQRVPDVGMRATETTFYVERV